MATVFATHAQDADTPDSWAVDMDANDDADTSSDDWNSVKFAKAWSEAANHIVKIMAEHANSPGCDAPHSAFICFDGFHGDDLDTLLTVCGRGGRSEKWRAVRWTCSCSENAQNAQQMSAVASIGDHLRQCGLKARLCLRLLRNGSWGGMTRPCPTS